MPDSHPAIVQIIQTFIEQLGIPTVMWWTQAAKNFSWSLSQTGHVNKPLTPTELVPPPMSPSSSHYVFTSCSYGSLPSLTLATLRASSNDDDMPMHSQPRIAHVVPDNSNSFLSNTAAGLVELYEQLANLQHKLTAGAEHEGQYEEQIVSLQTEVEMLTDWLVQHDKELAAI
jgi:hypothetical protein